MSLDRLNELCGADVSEVFEALTPLTVTAVGPAESVPANRLRRVLR